MYPTPIDCQKWCQCVIDLERPVEIPPTQYKCQNATLCDNTWMTKDSV